MGNNIMLSLCAAAGDYQTMKYFIQTIGAVTEDWECNISTHLNWNNPAPSWYGYCHSHEGLRCVNPQLLGINNSSSLSITLDVIASDSISFYSR